MAELAVTKQATFLWEGKDKKGNRVKGRGLARDEMEIRSDLRKQGIAATRVRKESKLFKSDGKVTAEDIALFARQLATMLNAGIPMVQSFEIIGVGNDKPAVQKLVLSIKSDIETGNSLHQSLAKHPLYFDDLFVNLVEAGEHAGALETVLEKIATYKEKTEALKKKIKKALFYPAAVLAVAIIVTVILLLFVIPQFESLFKRLRRGSAGVHAVRRQHVALDAGEGMDAGDHRWCRWYSHSPISTSVRGRCGNSSTRCRCRSRSSGRS
ncbi:MAG: type II secretion system F family protein [Steroidobacteraceae bacterium]